MGSRFRAAAIQRRLQEALADGETDLDEVASIHLEDDLAVAGILRDGLMAVPVGEDVATARALLDGWDGSMAVDSAAAASMAATLRHLLINTFDDELPEGVVVSDRGGWWLVLDELPERPDDPFWDDVTTEEIEDRDTMLVRALEDAADELVELLGDDVEEWRWGDLHTLELRHGTLGESGIAPVEALFNRGPLAVAGGGSVVNANGWELEKRLRRGLGPVDAARRRHVGTRRRPLDQPHRRVGPRVPPQRRRHRPPVGRGRVRPLVAVDRRGGGGDDPPARAAPVIGRAVVQLRPCLPEVSPRPTTGGTVACRPRAILA